MWHFLTKQNIKYLLGHFKSHFTNLSMIRCFGSRNVGNTDVGNKTDPQHNHPTVARYNRLRDCGHSYSVRSNLKCVEMLIRRISSCILQDEFLHSAGWIPVENVLEKKITLPYSLNMANTVQYVDILGM